MGIPSESAMSIAARQGAYDIVTGEDITVPSSGSVTFTELTSTGGDIAPCNVNIGGWNPCMLGGIKGKISVGIDGTVFPRKLKSVTFTRDEAGEAVVLPSGTKLVTASQTTDAEWNVIFAGTNGGWSADNLTASDHLAAGDESDLVKLINDMVNNTGNPDKCIIIGLTAGGTKYESVNEVLYNEFGTHFIDAKSYFASEEALADAGITATDEDTAAIAERAVPPSLLSDSIHYNDAGYELLAKLVFEKMKELGYNACPANAVEFALED